MTPPEGRRNTADILVIGAQRAMTTWAHQVFDTRPDTWAFPDFSPLTSTNKEAQFWTRHRHRGPDWYRVLMTPPERRARLAMDFTPDYARMSDEQIAECKALSPGARVIYILRDPLARAISALRMHTLWDLSTPPENAAALDHGPDIAARIARAALWEHGAYTANARRWARHYPDMVVVSYEDLAADPEAGARRLLGFCGLDPDRAAGLSGRAAHRVWATPAYRIAPDLVHWLHGATWAERESARVEFGFDFKEYEAILQNLHEEMA